MKPLTKRALYLVFMLNELMKKDRPEVPPTREELIASGTTKKDLKELERAGLVTSTVLVLKENYRDGGERTLGRTVYGLTPIGAATCESLGFQALKESVDTSTPVARVEAPIGTPVEPVEIQPEQAGT